jgi:hypothetical protein
MNIKGNEVCRNSRKQFVQYIFYTLLRSLCAGVSPKSLNFYSSFSGHEFGPVNDLFKYRPVPCLPLVKILFWISNAI